MWFTLRGGRLSEVFYPDLSTPSVRSLELTVSDGTTTDLQSHRHAHRGDAARRAQPAVHPGEHRPRRSVPGHGGGRHRPRPECRGHPRPARVARRRRLHAGGPLRPGARQRRRGRPGQEHRHQLLAAVDTDDRIASALVASPTLENGRDEHDVDLVQTATLPTTATGETTISLGFGRGRSRASATASAALARPWTTTRDAYDAGWHDYLSTLKPVPASAQSHPAPVPRQRPRPGGRRGQGPPGRVHRQPLDAVAVGRRGQGRQRPLLVVPRGVVARPLPDRHRPVRRWATRPRPGGR